MKISKALQKKIDRVVKEKVEIVAYNQQWVNSFKKEAIFLENKFPTIIKRIEHFGSTAVPGLAAKPVVDMLVEIMSFKEVKEKIVPVLESLGYDYFWRPEFDRPPMYAWFIKRNKKGHRTYHIHMVKKNSKLWERLYFRDYLRKYPQVAKKYGELKTALVTKYANDRIKYTKMKTEFVMKVTEKAKRH